MDASLGEASILLKSVRVANDNRARAPQDLKGERQALRWARRFDSVRFNATRHRAGGRIARMPSRVYSCLLVVIVACLEACQPPLCDSQANPGARYHLQLLDVYDASSTFRYVVGSSGWSQYGFQGSCLAADGFAPGTEVDLQGTGEVSDVHGICDYVTAQIVSAPSQLVVTGPVTDRSANLQAQNNQDFIYSVEEVSVGNCTGTMTLELYGGGGPGGIYATPIVGDYPPVVLYRNFSPSSPSCQPCEDNFVIQLSKV